MIKSETYLWKKYGEWEKNECVWIPKLIKPDKPLESVCKIKDFDIVLKQMLLVTRNWSKKKVIMSSRKAKGAIYYWPIVGCICKFMFFESTFCLCKSFDLNLYQREIGFDAPIRNLTFVACLICHLVATAIQFFISIRKIWISFKYTKNISELSLKVSLRLFLVNIPLTYFDLSFHPINWLSK